MIFSPALIKGIPEPKAKDDVDAGLTVFRAGGTLVQYHRRGRSRPSKD
jgi:hypothetical protein